MDKVFVLFCDKTEQLKSLCFTCLKEKKLYMYELNKKCPILGWITTKRNRVISGKEQQWQQC